MDMIGCAVFILNNADDLNELRDDNIATSFILLLIFLLPRSLPSVLLCSFHSGGLQLSRPKRSKCNIMKILFRVGSQPTSEFLQFCILSEEGAALASVPDVGVHHSPICRTHHTHHPSALVSQRFF